MMGKNRRPGAVDEPVQVIGGIAGFLFLLAVLWLCGVDLVGLWNSFWSWVWFFVKLAFWLALIAGAIFFVVWVTQREKWAQEDAARAEAHQAKQRRRAEEQAERERQAALAAQHAAEQRHLEHNRMLQKQKEEQQRAAARLLEMERLWALVPKILFCGRCKNSHPAGVRRCAFCNVEVELEERDAVQFVYRAAFLKSASQSAYAKYLTPAVSDQPARGVRKDFVAVVTQQYQRGDFVGLGNTILETLIVQQQDRNALPEGVLLAENERKFLAKYFDVPLSVSYACPHRDRFLRSERRGHWAEDHFVQLLITAYVLGATWESLPSPHDKLLPYYQLMARQQQASIEAAAERYRQRPQSIQDTDQVETELRSMLALGMDPAAIAAQIRTGLTKNGKPVSAANAKPMTLDDL
jgi:hypothetical protein